MALTADRDTPFREGSSYSYPMAASTHIYAGSLVVLDTAGNAEPATLATSKVAVGVAQEEVNNTGAAAAKNITVKTGVFRLGNHGSITKTSIGDMVYMYDDEAVQASGSSTSPAGRMVDIDALGVWVEIFNPSVGAGLLAANNLSDVGTAATARTNLGLGSGDSPTFTAVTTTGAATVAGLLGANGGVDRTTAAALAIGATNATAINIGATANPVAITGATGAIAAPSTVSAAGAITGPRALEVITVDETVGTAAADGGRVYLCATDGKYATLPTVAAGNKGMVVTIVNSGADGAVDTGFKVGANDYVKGTVANASADSVSTAVKGKGMMNTKATANNGDYMSVVSDGTNSWYIIGGVGIWAPEA
jgi:hypothetical protein